MSKTRPMPKYLKLGPVLNAASICLGRLNTACLIAYFKEIEVLFLK